MSSILQATHTFNLSQSLTSSPSTPPATTRSRTLTLLQNHPKFIHHQPFIQTVTPQDPEHDPAAREDGISLRSEWLSALKSTPELPPQLAKVVEFLGRQLADTAERGSNTPPVKLYTVTEKLPYVGRITITVALLSMEDGIASYAKAGFGTSVCGSFTVESEDAGTGESDQANPAATDAETLVLREYVILRGNKYLMPFIRGNAETGQKELLRNLAQEVRGESQAA